MPETCASARSQFFFLSPFVIFVFLFLNLVRCLFWNLQFVYRQISRTQKCEKNGMSERCFGSGVRFRTTFSHIRVSLRYPLFYGVQLIFDENFCVRFRFRGRLVSHSIDAPHNIALAHTLTHT